MQTFTKIFLLVCCFFSTMASAEELVSLDDATKKIIAESGSKVLGAKTESIDGKTMHVIKVLTEDGRVQHLKVDASTGKTIK